MCAQARLCVCARACVRVGGACMCACVCVCVRVGGAFVRMCVCVFNELVQSAGLYLFSQFQSSL